MFRSFFSTTALAIVLLVPRSAPAQTAERPERELWAVHAEGAATLGEPGGAFLGGVELRLDPLFGLELLAGAALEKGDSADATEGSSQTTFALLPGIRVLPFGQSSSVLQGVWLAGGVGGAYAAAEPRVAVVLHGGLDFALSGGAVGPFGGFMHLPSSGEVGSPEERVLFLVGIHGVLGGGRGAPPAAAPLPPLDAPSGHDGPAPDGTTATPRSPQLPVAAATSEGRPEAPSRPSSEAPRPASADEVLRVRLAETIQFPINGARIGVAASAQLRRAVSHLPTDGVVRVVVEGHSDATGSPAFNEALSLARAKSARDFLVSLGVPVELIVIEGYSASRPLDPGEGPAAQARNRRIEVVIERRGPAIPVSQVDSAATPEPPSPSP